MTPLALILHAASFLGLFALVLGCYLDTRARLHRLEQWRLGTGTPGTLRGRRKEVLP